MLVLTRKQSETIQIGDSITITVLRMKGKAVRLGIKAPHDFNVIRGELAFEQAEATGEVEANEEASDALSRASNYHQRMFQDNSWSTKASSSDSSVNSGAHAWSI